MSSTISRVKNECGESTDSWTIELSMPPPFKGKGGDRVKRLVGSPDSSDSKEGGKERGSHFTGLEARTHVTKNEKLGKRQAPQNPEN